MSSSKGIKGFRRKDIAKEGLEKRLEIARLLHNRIQAKEKGNAKDNQMAALINSFKGVWDSIDKAIGLDPSLLDAESRRTVLEQMQGIFEGERSNCPECGMALVCPWCEWKRGTETLADAMAEVTGNTVESTATEPARGVED